MPTKCSDCSKTFSNKYTLANHYDLQHRSILYLQIGNQVSPVVKNASGNWLCICTRLFPSINLLFEHAYFCGGKRYAARHGNRFQDIMPINPYIRNNDSHEFKLTSHGHKVGIHKITGAIVCFECQLAFASVAEVQEHCLAMNHKGLNETELEGFMSALSKTNPEYMGIIPGIPVKDGYYCQGCLQVGERNGQFYYHHYTPWSEVHQCQIQMVGNTPRRVEFKESDRKWKRKLYTSVKH